MTDPLKLADEARRCIGSLEAALVNFADLVEMRGDDSDEAELKSARESLDAIASALREQEKTIRVLRFAANLNLTKGMVKKLRKNAFCEGGELTFCTCGEVILGTAAEAYEMKVEEE